MLQNELDNKLESFLSCTHSDTMIKYMALIDHHKCQVCFHLIYYTFQLFSNDVGHTNSAYTQKYTIKEKLQAWYEKTVQASDMEFVSYITFAHC